MSVLWPAVGGKTAGLDPDEDGVVRCVLLLARLAGMCEELAWSGGENGNGESEVEEDSENGAWEIDDDMDESAISAPRCVGWAEGVFARGMGMLCFGGRLGGSGA